MKTRKLLYKSVGLLAGAGAGLIAGLVFKKVWQLASGDDDAPDALDQDKGWSEILLAAALQGAIFAIVKAAVDRGSAEGVRRLTGTWPA
jgi:Protein of unknown function (DUF4235)